MSPKTFICNTKHDFHNRIPKMGRKHKCISFDLILHSFGKMTTTFSTYLKLRRFNRNLKANTQNYLPTKNYNFAMGQLLPILSWTLSYFAEISSLTVSTFPSLFHINLHLKSFQIPKSIIIIINKTKDYKITYKSIHKHGFNLSLHEHDHFKTLACSKINFTMIDTKIPLIVYQNIMINDQKHQNKNQN